MYKCELIKLYVKDKVSSTFLFFFFSAGGVGVMMNLDPISKMLRQYSGMSVHGITDSGWFVEQPFNFAVQKKKDSPTSIEAVKMGIPYWHSQIPSKCRNLHIKYPSKCFLGYKIYPTLSGKHKCVWFIEFRFKTVVSKDILSVHILEVGLGQVICFGRPTLRQKSQ